MPLILRMEPTLHASVKAAADTAGASLNEFIVKVLAEKLASGTPVTSSVYDGVPFFGFHCDPNIMAAVVRYASMNKMADGRQITVDLAVERGLRLLLQDADTHQAHIVIPGPTAELLAQMAGDNPADADELLNEILWDGIAVRWVAYSLEDGRPVRKSLPAANAIRGGYEHYLAIADDVRSIPEPPSPHLVVEDPPAPLTLPRREHSKPRRRLARKG